MKAVDVPCVSYEGGAYFARVCPNCNRFVKADDTVDVNGLEDIIHKPNATCKKCGRVEMPFTGWYE